MAIQPFTRIVVDKKEEARFRRRALRHYPMEYMEALWGEVHGDILYVCAFVKMDIKKASVRTLWYDDQEFDFHEEDARESGLHFLGTIHTHPNCDDTRFGDVDLEMSQDSQEAVMGICAIKCLNKGRKNERNKCLIEYWPCVKPLIAIRKDWDAASIISKTGKKSGKHGKTRASKARKRC